MIVTKTALPGVLLLDVERREDDRGFFARTWCARELDEHEVSPVIVQTSISFNKVEGTFRGMHLQLPPHGETKVVRCTRGAVHDVVLDLRRASPTFGRHVGVDLTADNRRALYIPEGCAHGFLTLGPGSELLYYMSAYYAADAQAGLRWNDPAFGISLPAPVRVISERDANCPDYRPERFPL